MLRNLFYFLCFFVLLYIEPVEMGGIRIGILWKGALIGIILIRLMLSSKQPFPRFVFYNYLYSGKFLFTATTFSSLVSTVTQFSEALKSVTIGSVAHLFIVIGKQRGEYLWLERLSHKISIFIIFSTVPFLIGIIPSLNEGKVLDAYGIEESGFIGIFQGSHSASITLAFSLSVLTGALAKKRIENNRFFLYGLILIGIYSLYMTYVRAGFLIYLLALYFIYIKGKSVTTILVKFAPIITIGLLVFYIAYNSSQFLQMRFSDKNIYTEESYTPEDRWKQIGSGRFWIWYNVIANLEEASADAQIVGLGMEEAKVLMENRIGMRIFAHNQFLDSLQVSGLLGFTLFIAFLFTMYKFIKKRKTSQFYEIAITLFFGYIILNTVQGGHYFIVDIYLSIYAALLYLDDKEIKI